MGQAVRIGMPKGASAVVGNIASVMQRQIETRTGVPVTLAEEGWSHVELAVRPGPTDEAFEITNGLQGTPRIVGADEQWEPIPSLRGSDVRANEHLPCPTGRLSRGATYPRSLVREPQSLTSGTRPACLREPARVYWPSVAREGPIQQKRG